MITLRWLVRKHGGVVRLLWPNGQLMASLNSEVRGASYSLHDVFPGTRPGEAVAGSAASRNASRVYCAA